MTWDSFIWLALPAIALWASAGLVIYVPGRVRSANILMAAGILVLAGFIISFWISLGRPPMRTMGETRLWYSFFLSSAGFVIYRRWRYKWLLSFSSLMAIVFVLINLLKPEIHSRNLMPALQSIWFVPHVTVYMLSYALLGAATIASFIQLYKVQRSQADDTLYRLLDNLVYTGTGLLMLGMIMGSLWAKEAWGHFWSWDPKETWAFITAAAYLLYIHARKRKYPAKTILWILPLAFVLLMITWLGVNYLPSARGSIHVY